MEAVAVGARVLDGCVGPEGGIVRVPQAGLQAKEPLVPCQPPETQGPPGQGVEAFVGVCGEQTMGPHFMGGRHAFTVSDHIPGGHPCLWGGQGEGRTDFGILVRHFIVDFPSVPFNPLQTLAFSQDGSAHFLHPKCLPDWLARALRKCNGALAIQSDGVPYFRKMGAQEHSY